MFMQLLTKILHFAVVFLCRISFKHIQTGSDVSDLKCHWVFYVFMTQCNAADWLKFDFPFMILFWSKIFLWCTNKENHT